MMVVLITPSHEHNFTVANHKEELGEVEPLDYATQPKNKNNIFGTKFRIKLQSRFEKAALLKNYATIDIFLLILQNFPK